MSNNNFDQDILLCVELGKAIKKPLKGVKKELILGNLSMVWQQWAVDLFHIAEKRGVSLLETRLYTLKRYSTIMEFHVWGPNCKQD